MAGEQMLLVAISADRDGDVTIHQKTTLRDLFEACAVAEKSGFRLDDEIRYGFVREHLTDGIYVEKPRNWRGMSFDEVKALALRKGDPADEAFAWAELRRRAGAASAPEATL